MLGWFFLILTARGKSSLVALQCAEQIIVPVGFPLLFECSAQVTRQNKNFARSLDRTMVVLCRSCAFDRPSWLPRSRIKSFLNHQLRSEELMVPGCSTPPSSPTFAQCPFPAFPTSSHSIPQNPTDQQLVPGAAWSPWGSIDMTEKRSSRHPKLCLGEAALDATVEFIFKDSRLWQHTV